MCACSCLAVASLHTLHPPKPPSRLAPHFQVQLEAGPPSEEHPRLFSVVIHYSQRFITKVHPKTCMNRMLSHCEGATPGAPISTNALLLCVIKMWFQLIMNSLLFSPLTHLQQCKHCNFAIFQYAKHRYQNKSKTIESSDVFFNHWTLSITYNLLVHLRTSVCASSQRYPLATV